VSQKICGRYGFVRFLGKARFMSSIKPPSSGTTGPHAVPERADAPGGSQQTDRAESSSFQRSLAEANHANHANHANQAQQIVGAADGSADSVGQLARAVESGSVSFDQAVDQLLEQTLEKAGKHLTGEQRAELSELLRGALLSDPTLTALRG
jgi:predicted lipid-binding transport protein (Tim44 family)